MSRTPSRFVAYLEFGLTVAVLGVIGAFALEHLARLQAAADDASARTRAAQARSISALQQARGRPPNCDPASLSVSEETCPSNPGVQP